jgi:hypothetical protein
MHRAPSRVCGVRGIPPTADCVRRTDRLQRAAHKRVGLPLSPRFSGLHSVWADTYSERGGSEKNNVKPTCLSVSSHIQIHILSLCIQGVNIKNHIHFGATFWCHTDLLERAAHARVGVGLSIEATLRFRFTLCLSRKLAGRWQEGGRKLEGSWQEAGRKVALHACAGRLAKPTCFSVSRTRTGGGRPYLFNKGPLSS